MPTRGTERVQKEEGVELYVGTPQSEDPQGPHCHSERVTTFAVANLGYAAATLADRWFFTRIIAALKSVDIQLVTRRNKLQKSRCDPSG